MILIADRRSTKTDWCYGTGIEQLPESLQTRRNQSISSIRRKDRVYNLPRNSFLNWVFLFNVVLPSISLVQDACRLKQKVSYMSYKTTFLKPTSL